MVNESSFVRRVYEIKGNFRRGEDSLEQPKIRLMKQDYKKRTLIRTSKYCTNSVILLLLFSQDIVHGDLHSNEIPELLMKSEAFPFQTEKKMEDEECGGDWGKFKHGVPMNIANFF